MKADQVSGLFWILFALYVMHGSYGMELGSPRQPGSGFFPFLCAAFILFTAIILLVQSFIKGMGFNKRIRTLFSGIAWYRSAAIALIMAGYILFVERIGFILTAFGLMLLLLKAVERHSWKKSLIISILATAVAYVVFDRLLRASLPNGILWF